MSDGKRSSEKPISFEPDSSDDKYQIATLVVATLTVVAVIAMAMIFINPRVSFNPFKPPIIPTPIAIAFPTLPPTWTPTLSPIPTSTPTITPLPTSTLTATPTSAPTSAPTNSPTATARPPTRTPVIALPPTPIPSLYSYHAVKRSCTFGSPTQIKGKVTNGGSPVDGVRVRLATSSDAVNVVEDQAVKRDTDLSTIYAFIISPQDAGSFHIWLTDVQGASLSDPNYIVTINTLPANSPDSCWIAVLDFVR